MAVPMPNLPNDEAEGQEVQDDLVVEIEEDSEAGDAQPEAPEPDAPKAPVEPRKPEPQKAPEGDPAAQAASEDDDDDASLSEKVRKRINKLTYKQRKAEREREEFRQQLEAIRQERERERTQYEARTNQSDDLIIASREEALKAEMSRAQQDYLQAYRTGDEAALVSAQSKMVEVQVSQTELQRVKQRRDAMRGQTTQPSQPVPTQPQSQAWQNPPQGEDFTRLSAKAAELADDYIAKYAEWWDKDEVLTGSVLAIDKKLKAEGLKPWEPEFYEELDRRMSRRFPSEFGGSSREPAASATLASAPRPSQPVAGVSRGAATKGSVSVRLTAEDKAFCERNGIDLNAYAKEKHALERTNRQ